MAAQSPYEIVAAPFEVWTAPVGEAFPDIVDAPVGNWVKLGASGDKNYNEDGVVVIPGQTQEGFRPAGATAEVKRWRTEENLTVNLKVADFSAALVAKALNDATVTDTAAGSGTGGNLNFALYQGLTVTQFALLVRGEGVSADASADTDDFNTQLEIPRVVNDSSPEFAFKKGEPVMVEFNFVALYDSGSQFGTLRSQDEAAS